MQRAYIGALCELAEKDRNVLSLLADSGTGYDELFRKYFPEQLLDFGIAEENMVAAAAGLAMTGKIPFVYTAGAFLAYRSFEFIRDDICFQNANVKIVGMGSGLAWSTLGATHHTTEDLGALRALPNLTIFTPSCPREVEKVVKAAYEIQGPVYIRIGMSAEPDIYGADYAFIPGKAVELRKGRAVCLLSSGSILSEVLKAADLLKEQGIEPTIINLPTIVPFDEEKILDCLEDHLYMITIEEHSTTGGIGSAVAEVMAEHPSKAKLARIGLEHRFAAGYGTHAQIRQQNGLDAEGIADKILQIVKLRND